MRILAVISGEYGIRHVNNIRNRGPADWVVNIWTAPAILPPVVDYPEDYLPDSLPVAELILSFGEHKGVAELLPEIAEMTRAKAVIAAVDGEAWLPRGLARQLRRWLENMRVACVTPKPLCTLTETHYRVSRRELVAYQDPLIAAFARNFGQPDMDISVDPDTRLIQSVNVKRDAVCGCASYVAERLVGVSADEAEEKAGLLHHHYPCLASMGIDADYDDTLMHVSGNILKDIVGEQIKPYKSNDYIAPGKRSE